MKLGPTGKITVDKQIQEGSYSALFRRPSLKNPKNSIRRLLAVLASARDTGLAMQSREQILDMYDKQYSKRPKNLLRHLSDFYTWGWVDRMPNPNNKSWLLYSLKPDIDVNDVEDLYRILDENIKRLKGEAND